jgi:hypothetical protein
MFGQQENQRPLVSLPQTGRFVPSAHSKHRVLNFAHDQYSAITVHVHQHCALGLEGKLTKKKEQTRSCRPMRITYQWNVRITGCRGLRRTRMSTSRVTDWLGFFTLLIWIRATPSFLPSTFPVSSGPGVAATLPAASASRMTV